MVLLVKFHIVYLEVATAHVLKMILLYKLFYKPLEYFIPFKGLVSA